MPSLRLELFDGTNFNLSDDFDTKIARFGKKQVIFSHGDISDSLFYIEKGLVKLTATSRQGKEAIIGLFGTGHFFGESCLNSEQPTRYHNAVALTDMRVRMIARGSMIRLLHAGGDASYAFTRYLLVRSTRIQDDLINHLLTSSTERLARAFYSLVVTQQESGGERLARLSQQTLAEMIGTSRQRVNVLMRHLRHSGLVPKASPGRMNSTSIVGSNGGKTIQACAKSERASG